MKIVAGFLRSPEGKAALDRAIEEARLRDAELYVVHSTKGGERDEAETMASYDSELEAVDERLKSESIAYTIKRYARGQSPAEDLLTCAEDEGAEMIVIGVRRRTPVGKLVLGSNAQDILLKADCAVLAVKAAEGAE